MQAASGDQESALHAFKSILRQAPESPHTAKLLDDLCQQAGLQEDAAAFWRELGEAHPDADVPLLFLGMRLESSLTQLCRRRRSTLRRSKDGRWRTRSTPC